MLFVVSLSKRIDPSFHAVLVQPRKTRPYITERMLVGLNEKKIKQTKFDTGKQGTFSRGDLVFKSKQC